MDLKIKASDLVEILNFLPNLIELELDIDKEIILDESEKKIECESLESLKIFKSEKCESITKFLANYLKENSIKNLTFDHFEIQKIYFGFFESQKSIKFLKTPRLENFHSLKFLKLEEIFLNENFKFEDFKIISESQKSLKILKSVTHQSCNEEIWSEICKISSLEILSFNVREVKSGEKLENLKNLKELKIHFATFNRTFLNNFVNLNLNSLEKLEFHTHMEIPGEIWENFNKNFPNLKFLMVNATQKLNFYAKFLPNLKELWINYGDTNLTQIIEFDLKFSNFNLKKLKINFMLCQKPSNLTFEYLNEIFKIFPNLRDLEINCFYSNRDIANVFNVNKNFFTKINKIKNLKILKLSNLSLKNCNEDFDEIANEIKKITNKNLEFHFRDCLRESHEKFEKLSYKKIFESLKNEFEIIKNVREVKEFVDEENVVKNKLKIRSKG